MGSADVLGGRGRYAAPVAADVVSHFERHGWVLVDTVDERRLARLRREVEEVAAWPTEGPWLHHREMTDEGPVLCRSENFVPFHDGLRALLTTGPLVETASTLLGEGAVLYKEKINYKLPGGAGYAPHQDAPAYRFVETHISCMLAVDDATVRNGCLEVVSGAHGSLLPTDETGCIEPAVADLLTWAPVEVQAGQALWFHSRTPHRSGPNRSTSARRALYPTYNAAAEGDLRADYYRQKAAELTGAGAADGRVPVSLIGDFQGRPV